MEWVAGLGAASAAAAFRGSAERAHHAAAAGPVPDAASAGLVQDAAAAGDAPALQASGWSRRALQHLRTQRGERASDQNTLILS